MRIQPLSYLTFFLSLPLALLAAQGVDVRSTPIRNGDDERLQHPEEAIGSCIGERMTAGVSVR